MKRGDRIKIVDGGYKGQEGMIVWVDYDFNQLTIATDSRDELMTKIPQRCVEVVSACNICIPVV